MYSKPLMALTGLLLLQAVGVRYAASAERVPLAKPLETLPARLGHWNLLNDVPVESEVRDVLKADDILNRVYVNDARTMSASLFVAYFKSQRNGVAPHSPKNCLPGSGWVPVSSGAIGIQVPGEAQPIIVNRYFVSRGDDKTIVVYWYQSHHRVVASEYLAKFYLVLDAIRYRRSDTAVVRVVANVANGQTEIADKTITEFVQAFYPSLSSQLPM